MSIKMSKFRTFLFLAAVVLANIAVMGDFILYPVYDSMYGEFPENLMNLYVAMPQIMTVVFSFAAPVLIQKTSSRFTLITGGCLFTAGGLLGLFSDNIYFLLAARVPYGAGIAFCTVASIAVLSEVYVDEEKRGFVIGIYGALQSGVGAVLSIVSGQLGVGGWRKAFPLYWLGFLMIVMFVLFVPGIKKHQEEAKEESTESIRGPKEKFGVHFLLMTAAFILFTATIGVPNSYISTYVIENGIGNEATAGIMSSVMTCGGMVIGLFFGVMYKKLSGKIMLPWYGISFVGLAALAVFPNLVNAFLWEIILGGAMSVACSYSYAHIPAIVPASRVDDAIGVMSAACCLGYAISPYIISFTHVLTHSDRMTSSLYTCAVMTAAALLLEIVNNLSLHREVKYAQNAEQL